MDLAAMANPIQQGLKQIGATRLMASASCRNG